MEASGGDDSNMKIFKEIGELMTNSEFVSSSGDFFAKNCEVFDENVDENKHEYK